MILNLLDDAFFATILAMMNMIKNSTKRAMIKGIPVYRLTGLTDESLPMIKDTQMWIHYRHLGDAGWCLAVPDPLREAVMKWFTKHGLGLENLDQLPKQNILDYTMKVLAVAGLTLMAALVLGSSVKELASIAGLLVIALPFVVVGLLARGPKNGTPFGKFIGPTSVRTRQSFAAAATAEESAYFRYRSPGCAHMAGTLAHTMHGD